MNIHAVESLFLQQDKSNFEDDKFNAERLASLKNDVALQRLHRLKKVESIVSALQHIEERKFEEAFADVKLLNAILEYEMMFEEGEERLKDFLTKSNKEVTPEGTIKY